MRKKNIKKIIIISVFTVLCFSLIAGIVLGFFSEKTRKQNQGKDLIQTNQNFISTSTDQFEAKKEKGIEQIPFSKRAIFKVGEDEFTIQVSEHTTVYDAMNDLMSEGKMTFEGKDYPGLGFFVTQINSLVSGDGKNLMYYINNKEASLGVSTYVIKEGDIIEWKLK